MFHTTIASQCKPPEELMSHAKCEHSASVNNRLICECDSGMRFSNGQTEADMVCTETGLWSHHSGDCMGKPIQLQVNEQFRQFWSTFCQSLLKNNILN